MFGREVVLVAVAQALLAAPVIGQAVLNESGVLRAPDAAPYSKFGSDVAIDDRTVIVGAGDVWHSGLGGIGAAYAFLRTGDSWSQQGVLTASDWDAGDHFGAAVAVSGDSALIGAPGDDLPAGAQSGSAYVFVRNGSTWSEQAKLVASDAGTIDHVGEAVALDGDTALLGMSGGSGTGAAYVFVRNGSTWTEQAKLTASDGAVLGSFGVSVALSGNTAVVGAPFVDDGVAGADVGAVYVFVRHGSVWSEQAKLMASDAIASAFLGEAVSCSGNTVVAGARTGGIVVGAGAAYVFVRSGSTWSQQAKLLDPDPLPYDDFGASVAVRGNRIVVGAPRRDVAGENAAGSVTLFERSGTSWTEQATLQAAAPHEGEFLGQRVALSRDLVLAGTPGDDLGKGPWTGSARVFQVSGSILSELGAGWPVVAAYLGWK